MLAIILSVVLGFTTVALPGALLSPQETAAGAATTRTANGCPIDRAWTDDVLAAVLDVPEEKVRKLHDIRGLTGLEICTMARAKLDRALIKVDQEPRPDQPREAAEFRRKQQAGDDGQVRPDGLVKALAQRAALVSPAGFDAAGIDRNSWIAIGPGNIGGRIRAVVTHPTDPDLLFVGSVTGGLWRSTDGGTSWAAINDFMPNVAISTLVRDPSNPLRMYAGTGESSTGQRGYGVFRSVDGGTTWTQMPNTVPDTNVPPTLPGVLPSADFFYVNRIVVHPTNPDIVLVAASQYYHCGSGGIWRTANATAVTPTWTRVYPRAAGDVRFDPTNGSRAILGELAHSDGACTADGGGVAWSADAGATFTRIALDTLTKGRVEVSWAPATPGLAVAVTEGNGGAGASGRLWRTNNAGLAWSLNSQPGHLGDQGWYDNSVWVDPTDSTRIVVGGIDLYKGAGVASWWTTNTAVAWTKISRWDLWPLSVHADNHAIVNASNYNGTSNRVVYIGDDGGLWKSTDIASHNGVDFTTNWVNLNNGLPITQFYSGAAAIAGGVERIVGGTQDNGSLKAPVATSGTTWSTFFGGDGGYSAVDPTDPDYYYGEYVRAAIHRATTGGNSSVICAGPNPISEGETGFCGAGATKKANFIAPFVLDPNNANTMLVGANSLWRSTNVKTAAQPDWFAVKSPDVADADNFISAIAVARGNSNIIWVGHNHGEVYCTVNGTAASPTWTKVTALTATRMVLRLLVDEFAPSGRVYVTYGGFNGGNIQELNDATQVCKAAPAVTDRHGNLPQAPVRSIVRAGNATFSLFAGTEVGIFGSTDGGVTWSASNDGPGTVTVDELFWVDRYRLFAATFGRGMFKTNLAPPSCTPLTNNVAKTFLFGALNTQQCFAITVPALQQYFDVRTSDGTGDPDLYVRRGAIPTLAVNDCASEVVGTDEACSFASPVADTWYVMVSAYESFDGHTLTAEYGVCTPLANNVPVTGLSGLTNSQKCFRIDVPAGQSILAVQTSGGTGDADLYVKQGSIPTPSDFNCESAGATTDEACTFPTPTAAPWYVTLYGYESYSGVTLTARYSAIAAPTVTTGAATGVTATGATLNGAVSSNGASTTVTFQHGLTAGYGSTVTAAQSPLPADAATAAVSAAITGLACNTPYHYRAVGANSADTSNGADQTFTTAPCTLDVDGSITSTRYDALTDGLLIVRYLFGLTGTALTSGALGATATRADPAAIKAYLDGLRPHLDVDDSGQPGAATDGLLILRYLLGLRGSALISGALDPLAKRTSAAQIEAYLQTLLP